MTVQLNVESRVDIKPGSSEQTLKKLGGESRNFGTAMREAAAEAKAAGGSISQSVQAVTREVQEAGRRQVNDARAAAQSKRGVERQAANERLEEIRRAAQQEIEAARVAANAVIAEARRKAAAERQAAEAIRKAQVGQRMGATQLGMQMNDVATQAASGTAPLIIFAQQANQVGYAMTMMGGTAAKVGGIFAGPWGAAITVASMVLGVLITSLRGGEAAMKAQEAAAEDHKKALEALDAATGRLNKSQEESIRIGVAVARKDLEGAIAARQRAQAEMEKAQAFIRAQEAMGMSGGDPGARAAMGAGMAAGAMRVRDLSADIAASKAAEATAQARLANATYASTLARVKGELDPVVKATQDYERAQTRLRAQFEKGKISEAQLTAGLIKSEKDLTAAKDAASAASKAQGAAAREAKKAERDAQREAKKSLEEQIRLVEKLELAAAKATSTDLFKPGLVDDYFKKQEQARKNDELSRVVGEADNRRAGAKEEAKVKADAFNKAMLGYATTIGDAIGNEAGRSAASVVGALISGDAGRLRGPGGNVARGLLDIAGTKEIKEAFRPLVAQMKTVFGDQPFGKELGKAFEAAGFGAGVAALIGKGSKEESIGGAIGAMGGQALGNAIAGPLGGAIGKIAGSIIGTAIGGLFVKPKTGSVTITGSGGEIGVSDAVGTGGSQKKNATAAGNSLSDALRQFAEQIGGTIGDFSVSIGQSGKNWRVDTSGAGRTNRKNAGVLAFGEDAEAAYAAALADAIRDGAIGGVSPRVQAAIQRYADDVNRALSEAIKVQNLENWLADRKDPFAAAFREFERQAAERVRVARQYGFDVLEIEKANAEERAKLIKEQTEASGRPSTIASRMSAARPTGA